MFGPPDYRRHPGMRKEWHPRADDYLDDDEEPGEICPLCRDWFEELEPEGICRACLDGMPADEAEEMP